MNGPLHDIDNLFYNGIEGHAEYPSDRVWENIEADLDKNTANTYKRKYKALKRSAFILLSLFIVVLIYETVNIFRQKENISAIRRQDAADHEQYSAGDISIAVSPKYGENVMTPPRENTVNEYRETVKPSRLPATVNFGEGDVSYDQPYNTGVLNKEEVTANNQAGNNSFVTNKTDLTVRMPGAYSGESRDKAADASMDLPVLENNYNDREQSSRLLSFSLTRIGNPLKKDITAVSRPAVSNAAYMPATRAISMVSPVDSRDSRFSLSAYFLPGITRNVVKDDKQPPSANGGGNGSGGNGGGTGGGSNGGGNSSVVRSEGRKEIQQTEANNLAYSGGVRLSYNLLKRLSVETGLGYLVSSTTTKSKQIYAARDDNGNVGYRLNCSSGYILLAPSQGVSSLSAGDSIKINDSRNTVSYLTVPVAIEYKIVSSRRFSLAASAGGQANILLNGKTTAVLNAGTRGESEVSGNTQGLKSSYFSLLTSITGEMTLNRHLSVTLSPTGQFGLSYMNEGASVKTRPNYLGLAAGLRWRW